MPTAPTYPGVYIEEVPSGVRTITGVSTSVTAFVGQAKRGPINRAEHIQSYADYERRFGGLHADSEMSYAVRQFFLNGGSDSWVVRLAKNAKAAERKLQNGAGVDVLEIRALDEGEAGNSIQVRVDYQIPKIGNPSSNFNLTLTYAPLDNPSDSLTERFENLSMNSHDARYVEQMVRGVSQLVDVTRVHAATGLGPGRSTSGELVDEDNVPLDVDVLRTDSQNQFRVSVNGLDPVSVTLTPADVTGDSVDARLATLCGAIQSQVQTAAVATPELNGFTCEISGRRLVLKSGVAGEASTVRVLPGERNDIAAALKLGTINGGTEVDAVAEIRPREVPERATLSGTAIVDSLETLPAATASSFKLSLDGQGPDAVNLGSTAAAGDTAEKRLGDIAGRIQKAVRKLKPGEDAYKHFTCTVVDGNKLQLSSGTSGTGSSVVVDAADANDIAGNLGLLAGATATHPRDVMLETGAGEAYTDDEAYPLFIASRAERKGIYALEEVDLFNLLCLPGITNAGILMDADSYCKERRAFLIVDPPKDKTDPDDMVDVASGSALPKTEYGAVYYPRVKIADPLANGRLLSRAPSGTIAGLYARTDSTRGVWKAPAGTDATLVGVQAVDYALTDRQNGTLNPLGVNCIRVFPVYGAVAWGARTLRGADQMTSEYKYIPIRRLALYIEESLYRGTKWVVFEPNDEPLWAQIRLNVGAFMHNLFRQGAFQGASPRDAYFVKCDKETTTQNDRNLGIVNIVVGFAPLKPAEFVIIKIQQIAGKIET